MSVTRSSRPDVSFSYHLATRLLYREGTICDLRSRCLLCESVPPGHMPIEHARKWGFALAKVVDPSPSAQDLRASDIPAAERDVFTRAPTRASNGICAGPGGLSSQVRLGLAPEDQFSNVPHSQPIEAKAVSCRE